MTELVIEAQGISRSFGDFCAVHPFDLQVEKSVIYGFLGPNGCGKSTTIRMLTGLLTPSSGQLKVLGIDLPKYSEQLKSYIGYMTQKFSLYTNLTIYENLTFVASIYGLNAKKQKQRISELLAIYGLDTIKHQLTSGLSGGQKQRLALAAAVLNKPKLLFLDEPTSAVDPENRRDFWEQLYDLCEQGTTILVSTHYMDEAERCHQLAILEAGQLRANGSPKHLMEQINANVVEVDGTDLRTIKNNLIALQPVYSAAQLGTRLRVLIDKSIEDPIEWLRQQLCFSHSINRQIDKVRPSLEDVFVRFTGEGRQ